MQSLIIYIMLYSGYTGCCYD